MLVNQISTMLNELGEAMVGLDVTFADDLSNIVDAGKKVLDFTTADTKNFDNFMEKMIDRVGKEMYVNRPYVSQAPNLIKDSWTMDQSS